MTDTTDQTKRLAGWLAGAGLAGWLVVCGLFLKGGSGWLAITAGGLSAAAILLVLVTVARKYERRLAEMALHLRACLEQSSDAVTIEKDGDIVFANQAALSMFGLSRPEEIVGHRSMDFIAPSVRDELRTQLVRVGEQSQIVKHADVCHVRADGTQFLCDMTWLPLRVGGERLRVAFVRETREKEQKPSLVTGLMPVQEDVHLTGGFAHDIKNLLHVINGASELASETEDVTSSTRELLESIRKAGQGAATLMEQMNGGGVRRRMKKETLDITGLVTLALKRLESSIDPKIQITCFFSREPLFVRCEADALNLVFSILCAHACQAMADEGVLTISTERLWLDGSKLTECASLPAGSYAVMAVTETGNGEGVFASGDAEEVGVSEGESPESGSPGIPYVRDILMRLGGFVSVDQVSGSGKTVRIYLPLASEQGDDSDLPCDHFCGDETILVAEDDEAVRSLTSRILRKAGYTVLETEDGAQAIEVLHTAGDKVDGLVFDLIMPRMGGLEAYDKIKKDHPNIPVIFVSAFSEQALDVHWGLVDGVNFVRKPFKRVMLLKVLRQCLDRRIG